MRIFDFSVPQGQVREVIAKGSFVMYLDGSGGLDGAMSLRVPGQGEVVMLPGQSLRLPVDSSRFLVVGDREAATVSGRLIIGEGSFEDRRLFGAVQASQAGEWVMRTLAEAAFAESKAFIGTVRHTVATAGRPYVGVYGFGGIIARVRRIMATASDASRLTIGFGIPGSVVAGATNKRGGGPAPAASLRSGESGSSPVVTPLLRVDVDAGERFVWEPMPPIVPQTSGGGTSVVIESDATGVGKWVEAVIEWEEP